MIPSVLDHHQTELEYALPVRPSIQEAGKIESDRCKSPILRALRYLLTPQTSVNIVTYETKKC
jgi:hypothetical protein